MNAGRFESDFDEDNNLRDIVWAGLAELIKTAAVRAELRADGSILALTYEQYRGTLDGKVYSASVR